MQHPSSADGGATLHLLCGKIGAGKSTLSQQLAAKPRHVLISEDAWLATLHPGEIHSVADYLQRAATLRSVLTDHLRTLLQAGVSVVLDFPFNTPPPAGGLVRCSRQWAPRINCTSSISPTRSARRGCVHAMHAASILPGQR